MAGELVNSSSTTVNRDNSAQDREESLGNLWAAKATIDALAAALAQGVDMDEGLVPALQHISSLLDRPLITIMDARLA